MISAPAHHIHMVALIFVTSSSLCSGEFKPYKVRDNNEEYADPKGYARSFAPDDDSGGFYGAGFHFPDFFNDGNNDGNSDRDFVGDKFGSPFPSESRSSDSSYIIPAANFRTDVVPKNSRSHSPAVGEYRQKNPILTLYDDWTPDTLPRHKWSPEQSRNTKWSQEHTDDDSGESSPGQLSGPYRSTGSPSRPYSEASLKQHYKPINPPDGTHLSGEGDVRTHAHKYGVNHVYDRKKKPEEPNYEQHDDNLNNRRPQQFSPDPNPHRNPPRRPSYTKYTNHPSVYRSRSHPSQYNHRNDRILTYPKEFHRNFSPSPPGAFRNPRNYDFFTDSSNTAPTKIKAVPSDSESEPDDSRKNDQLDKSCKKSEKSTTINLSDGAISLQCYDCYDAHHKRPYEQCVQVPDRSDRKKRSVKSSSTAQTVPAGRGKRQGNNYYDDGNYGPDSSDYRFGPEHFTDEYPNSYDDGEEANPEETEKCLKSRKGDMLCISCENKNTGGTYEQCSYASDPKKNSYERSVSKVFGSPRLPEENRRKVEGETRKAAVPKKPQRSRPGAINQAPSGSRGQADGFDDGSTFRSSAPMRKKNHGPVNGKIGYGQIPKFRGTQGRSPLPPPVRGTLRDRSITKTPASTSLKGPSRMGLMSNLKGRNSFTAKRNPPPGSRAYSTPSPVGPDPYSYDLPDPYNPDLGEAGSRNRKNFDSSYEPGYDETFADLFPELIDTDPSSAVALAPPSYDEEYSDEYSDYDDVPVRRRDEDTIQNGSRIHSTPPTRLEKTKTEPKKQKICKRVRKNKMTCLHCVDEKGAKQEECTYLAGADPKSKHMTYREVKEMSYEPSEKKPVGSVENQRSKRKSKKYTPVERLAKASNPGQKGNAMVDRPDNTSRPEPGPRHSKEAREELEDPEEKIDAEIDRSTRKNYNPVPTDPPESDDFGEKMSEDGEFSADTEMKFDPVLGMSLPKYMLDKSEGEAIFDEVLASSYKDQ